MAAKSGKGYVPDRGDLVWLSFDPQLGHEQRGRRPAVVVSPASYNRRAGLAIFCPVTSQVKGYPFEVVIPTGLRVGGVILSDQGKSLDWRARNIALIARLPRSVVVELLQKIEVLIRPNE